MDSQDAILLVVVIIIILAIRSKSQNVDNNINNNLGDNLEYENGGINVENSNPNPYFNSPLEPPEPDPIDWYETPPQQTEEDEDIPFEDPIDYTVEESEPESELEPLPVRRYTINSPWGMNDGMHFGEYPRTIPFDQCVKEATTYPHGAEFTYDNQSFACYVYDHVDSPQQENNYTFGFEIDPCCDWLNPPNEGDYVPSPTGIDVNAWNISLNTRSNGGDVPDYLGFPKAMSLYECEAETRSLADTIEVAGFAYKFPNTCRPKTYFMPVHNQGYRDAIFEFK